MSILTIGERIEKLTEMREVLRCIRTHRSAHCFFERGIFASMNLNFSKEEILSALKATRSKIDTPLKWTQNISARLVEDGDIAYCLTGAVGVVSMELYPDNAAIFNKRIAMEQHLLVLLTNLPGYGVMNLVYLVYWNDHHARRHEEVLARIDAAIAQVETLSS